MNWTSIQWTWATDSAGNLIPNSGSTWNPLLGCRRVLPGCSGCYAERLIATRMSKNPKLPMYHDLARLTDKGEPQFTGVRRMLVDRLDEPLRARKGRKVFVCDMGDLFFEGHPFEDIAAVFGVMAAAPRHTFQVLTKRAKRMAEFFAWIEKRAEDGKALFPDDSREWRIWQLLYVSARKAGAEVPSHHGGAWPLRNVWLGVSVEDQQRADERIPLLLQTPAAVRFLSCEPLLERVEIGHWLHLPPCPQHPGERAAGWGHLPCDCRPHIEAHAAAGRMGKVDWVIVGGESGTRARPFDLGWARAIVRQCHDAGVPVFVKQLGAKPCEDLRPTGNFRTHEGRRQFEMTASRVTILDSHGGDPLEWPEDLRVREFPRLSSLQKSSAGCVYA